MIWILLMLICLVPLGIMLELVLARAADARQQRNSLEVFELRFPTNLDTDGVQAFIGGITGLLPPWWRRLWHTPFIGTEVLADRDGTHHRLLVPQAYARHVESSLAAHLPAVRYERSTDLSYPRLDCGVEYRLTSAERSLSIDSVQLSAGLLSSLQPLFGDEAVVVQLLLAPARPVSPPRLATTAERERAANLDDGVLLNS